MTSMERDPGLEALFADAPKPEAGEAFTHAVMRRTRRVRWRMLALALLIPTLLLALLLAFSVPVGAAALWVVEVVATPLIDLPAGWWSLILAPLNTLGTALVVLARGIRLLARRAIGAAYED
jgi:hypothetical protein